MVFPHSAINNARSILRISFLVNNRAQRESVPGEPGAALDPPAGSRIVGMSRLATLSIAFVNYAL